MTATLTPEQSVRLLASAAGIERVLTVQQPWADLILAGAKDVENRTWGVPSTLPQWYRCAQPQRGHVRREPALVARTGPRVCDVADGPFPFRLWVHAGKRYDDWAWEALHLRGLRQVGTIPSHPTDDYPLGALLGSVTVTGCHHADDCERREPRSDYEDVPEGLDPFGATRLVGHCSRWAEPDVWHWTLTDPQPLDTPIPMRGRQSLWTVPDDILTLAGTAAEA